MSGFCPCFTQERLRGIAEESARVEALRRAQEAHEAAVREREVAEIRRREAAAERLQAEARKRQVVQEKLRQLSPCPAGFQWTQMNGGWRCGGGSHFVSDAELNRSFMH